MAQAVGGRRTVGQYLEEWLEIVRPTVRESAWIRYEQLVRVHLVPGLGKLRLERLGPRDVQAFYAKKLAAGEVASTTVQRMHQVLHHALGDALRLELVARNVTDLVDPPRPSTVEMTPLSSDDVGTLLRACEGERLGAIYVLAVATGMRSGELLALRWDDVDLDGGRLQVRRSLTRTAHGYIAGETKTRAGRRTLVLPGLAVVALRRHRAQQAQDRLALGARWHDNGLVFPADDGTILDGSALRHRFESFTRRHGLPRIRFHDLRHTAATTLLGEHADLKVISSALGHARIQVTADTYLHVTEGLHGIAGELMEQALTRAMRGSGASADEDDSKDDGKDDSEDGEDQEHEARAKSRRGHGRLGARQLQ